MQLTSKRLTCRILPGLATLGTIALLGGSLMVSQGRDAQAAGHQRGGPPRLKNIRILKNMTPAQVIAVMRSVSASLGVECDFCHVRGDFASDAKATKHTAREMMLMTNRLNTHERILSKQATCYMCHHGHAMPETHPPAGEPGERGERGEGGARP
ncbi:MAG TPA: c-type cytochrome [Chthonomonadaceae bacterium]|nr:c-type cytochrome [Chthonomonadaceae bacterium]